MGLNIGGGVDERIDAAAVTRRLEAEAYRRAWGRGVLEGIEDHLHEVEDMAAARPADERQRAATARDAAVLADAALNEVLAADSKV